MANERRRRRRKDTDQPSSEQGSILFTILLLGLAFCLVDVLYLFIATHNQDDNSPALAAADGRQSSQVEGDHTAHQHKANLGSPLHQSNKNNDGKSRILDIIRDAGLYNKVTPEVLEQLPTWDQVIDLVGPEPQIHGLDTCQAFQNSIEPAERFIAPAGIFNSGTNLMAELLIANCFNPERSKKYGRQNTGVRWQVNWGKHQPPKHRLTDHAVYEDKKVSLKNINILPVVTVRHPYNWMQSMCRHRYATHWFHEATLHCPNLVPNEIEQEFLPLAIDGSYKRDRIDLHKKDPWLMDNVMNIANFTLDMEAVPVYVKYKVRACDLRNTQAQQLC